MLFIHTRARTHMRKIYILCVRFLLGFETVGARVERFVTFCVCERVSNALLLIIVRCVSYDCTRWCGRRVAPVCPSCHPLPVMIYDL